MKIKKTLEIPVDEIIIALRKQGYKIPDPYRIKGQKESYSNDLDKIKVSWYEFEEEIPF